MIKLKEPETITMIIIDVYSTRIKVPKNLSYEEQREYAYHNKLMKREGKIHQRLLYPGEEYEIHCKNKY